MQPEEKNPHDDMLDLIVSEALAGVDITVRYPAFYAAMQKDKALHGRFLDLMAVLEADDTEQVPPGIYSQLKANMSQRLQELYPHKLSQLEGITLVNWTFPQFEPQLLLGMPSRRGFDYPEDKIDVLIQEDIPLAGSELYVSLHLKRPSSPHTPYTPHCFLVMYQDDEELECTDIHCDITLIWGDYKQTRPLNQECEAEFPPLPMHTQSGQPLPDFQFQLTLR